MIIADLIEMVRARMENEVTLFAVFFAGLISFASPCVLPLVPPYLCYLAGTTLDQLSGEADVPPDLQRRVLISAMLFVLGFSTVFIALGASASLIGQTLSTHLDLLAKIAGLLIIAMGLHFLGLLPLRFLYREMRFHQAPRAGTMVGAYVMGLAFAFGWTPCIGPVLAAVLAIAASRETVGSGMGLLAIYAAGIGVPFMAAAFAVQPFQRFAQRFRPWMGTIEKIMGALLVLTGIMFLTGLMSSISYWLLETFPTLGQIG